MGKSSVEAMFLDIIRARAGEGDVTIETSNGSTHTGAAVIGTAESGPGGPVGATGRVPVTVDVTEAGGAVWSIPIAHVVAVGTVVGS